MLSTSSLLGAWHLGDVVENKPESLFVVFLGKALKGMSPPFMRKTGDPDTSEMGIPKRVQTSRPKYSDAFRFLVNGG